ERLHKFRESGKFINTAEEFRAVTKVPDSIFDRISPYFKFPEFRQRNTVAEVAVAPYEKTDKLIAAIDINTAREEDFVKISGIGPQYAKMILRRRAQLGSFVSMEQMHDFTELSTEVAGRLKKQFEVKGSPAVVKINLNTASLHQLSYFPYFNRTIAKAVL